MELAPVDIVFLIMVVFTTIRAGIRGFVKEIMSVAALFLGIGGAVLFSGVLAEHVEQNFGESVWTQVIAFLALFLVIYIVVKVFENALNRLIERIHLDSLDHAAGFFLGVAEGLLLVFVLLLLIQVQPIVRPELLIAESVFAHALLPLLPFAAQFLNLTAGNV
ncbi:MAG: CvpA family protein [Spirochaetaceae bacterium]|nr:MAG: CvpA family protein [Spirochaetaceae bacterium]